MGSSVGSDCRHGGGIRQKAVDGAWYYSETRGFDSCLVRLDLQQGTETVVSPDKHGSVDCFDRFDGEFLYVAMRDNGLQEIYTCKEGEGEERKLTDLNGEFLRTHSVCPLHRLSFT